MGVREEGLIEIDGSHGEGGGQILRTALALSAIYRKPITVHHIRSKRRNPGLRSQHLKAVEALGQITGAQIQGAHLGSETVTFIPQRVSPGDYRFEIGNGKRSAGSVTLLLQSLLPPLILCQECSRLTLVGGTHVLWSPPFHYFSMVLLPTLASLGISMGMEIEKWGWYPQGEGMIQVLIQPSGVLKPITLVNRGSLRRIHGLSAASNLPRHVSERQRDEVIRRVEKEMRMEAEVVLLPNVPARGPGSFLLLVAEFEGTVAGFSSLGAKGKRAEEVAKEAVEAFKEFLRSEGCIDPHLGDQLVPFMALTKGRSSFTTTQITEHLRTNLWVIQHFFDGKISTWGEKGKGGGIEISNE